MPSTPPREARVSASRRPKFGLMRLFAVAGALAIGVFSLSMGLLLGRFIESRMLERDGAVSRDFVQSIASTQRVAQVLRSGAGARAMGDPQFAEFIDHLGAMPDVLRVNVYSTERVLLWSTRSEMIGRRFEVNHELDQALRGEVVVHTAAAPDKAEHMLLGARHRYVENYVPVVDESQHVIAVVELYRRPDALFEAIGSGQRLIALGAAGGGLFLFVCLIGFVMHAERRLREQQRRLVDAEAMAIVGEISAAVAHSIRNPLGSIRSSAELQRELSNDANGSQSEIMRHVDRIEALVRSMLAYAANIPEREVHTELDGVVDEVSHGFAAELAHQDKRLELDLQRGIGRVEAEAVLIAQMLQTLLTNAAEATRAGGHIRLRSCREGTNAILEVSDDGVGIAPERIDQVLKPFHTSKPGGLGVGLALAHRVARRLGGDIVITSNPGVGTCVRLSLPVHS